MIKICGVMFAHENNDFSFWNGFNLSSEDENRIQEILSKYDTEGFSVCGNYGDVLKDLLK